jgi:hypothetical protein
VIIFQIDIDGIAFGPSKRDPPVSAGVDRMAAFIAANERMKAEARQVHVLGSRGVVKRSQNIGKSFRILNAQPASLSRSEEAFKDLVSERPDHTTM